MNMMFNIHHQNDHNDHQNCAGEWEVDCWNAKTMMMMISYRDDSLSPPVHPEDVDPEVIDIIIV